MIFITLGSQKFQFNRLLHAMDDLIEKGEIHEEVFAQIGYSDYVPQHYRYQQFLNRDEYDAMLEASDVVVTHGGTGAIIGAIKNEKRVVAIPRLAKYGEHVDNHQLQIVNQFHEMNLICGCKNVSNLGKAINMARLKRFQKYISNTNAIIEDIEQYIE